MADDSVDGRRLDDAAAILHTVRTDVSPIGRLPANLQPESLEESYLIQDRLNARLAESGFGRPVGYKIGCTTPVMQAYLGIPHPCAGRVFKSMTRRHAAAFDRDRLCRPGVECEIGVRLGRDMDAPRDYAANDCEAYVDCAMAGIELVDDRWTDFHAVATPTLVSDNFFNAGCVFGETVRVSGADLKGAAGTMWINGEMVGSGTGTDILGHPYEALAWLANHQVRRGKPLAAGDYVSLGSVVQTRWIGTGDLVEIEFTGLGGCSLRLE